MTNNEILRINDLQTHFFTDEGVVKAVDNVNLALRKGEALGLVGESGCGKSITAFSILRLVPDPPGKIVGGEILFKGQDLLKFSEKQMCQVRGNAISMIFQEPSSAMNPAFTIGNQMKEVIRFHQGGTKNRIMDKMIAGLEEVQIPDPQRILKQYPHQLSGGMLQRVMIAIALSCEAEILICDEPSTALDVSTQAQIIKLLNELRKKKETSLVFITHDLGVLASVCTSAAVMYAGSIVEYSDIESILLRPSHPYTQALMGSTCRLDQDHSSLQVIQGQVPNLARLPSGCKFHPRCERAEPMCQAQAPTLEEKEKGHWAACHLV